MPHTARWLENTIPPLAQISAKVEQNGEMIVDSYGFASPPRYGNSSPMVRGSSGLVIRATDQQTGQQVAIKRIMAPFRHLAIARRAYREFHLLRHLNHPYVVHVFDGWIYGPENDLYMVARYEPFDLRSLLRGKRIPLGYGPDGLPLKPDDEAAAGLEGDQVPQETEVRPVNAPRAGQTPPIVPTPPAEFRPQPIPLQGHALPLPLLRRVVHCCLQALQYVHGCGIVHRDLKPENILFDPERDQFKVCDFGLARALDFDMTGYVSTRWYRAPEIMLTWREYGPAVDLWSLGCIMAEMATGRVLFPARDHVEHVRQILQLTGTPSEEVLGRVCGEATRAYLRLLPHYPPADLDAQYGHLLGADGVDLLRRLLDFDKVDRISAAQALQHPFVAHLPCRPCVPVPYQDEKYHDNLSGTELLQLVKELAACYRGKQV